ncbi:MAG TPA: hypothetical protein VG711_08410, partial [Phycisphaerales bacterium]|nr:hypothetical protein [Phycisphaerales bacterium]
MAAKSVLGCAVIGASIVTPSAFAGPEWVEHNDAGSIVTTAQRTAGPGQLTSIAGHLTGGIGTSLTFGESDFEDMYLIQITDPSSFTMQVIGADFDAQLFLFNVTLPGEGFGLLANDDFNDNTSPFIGNMATDGTGAQINLPGVYAIAISGFGRNPVSIGGEIFDMEFGDEISGPDGPGGINPHTGWTGDGQTG